ncbi:MAG: hypothetical protein ACI30X_07105 [Muribaculaceae bacterium]
MSIIQLIVVIALGLSAIAIICSIIIIEQLERRCKSLTDQCSWLQDQNFDLYYHNGYVCDKALAIGTHLHISFYNEAYEHHFSILVGNVGSEACAKQLATRLNNIAMKRHAVPVHVDNQPNCENGL